VVQFESQYRECKVSSRQYGANTRRPADTIPRCERMVSADRTLEWTKPGVAADLSRDALRATASAKLKGIYANVISAGGRNAISGRTHRRLCLGGSAEAADGRYSAAVYAKYSGQHRLRAIATLPGPPFQALRKQFEEYRAAGRCTLIGGVKTSMDHSTIQLGPRTLRRCSPQLLVTRRALPSEPQFRDCPRRGGACRGVGRGIDASARRRVRNRIPVHSGCPCGCGWIALGEQDGG
jgi:hypothetical protein